MLDALLLFSDAQAVTATAASTNIIDLSVARDLGVSGDDMPLMVLVTSDNKFASATSAALMQIQVQGAPDNGSGSPGSYTTMAQSDTISVANLNKGFNGAQSPNGGTELFPIHLPSPKPGQAFPRFLRLNYVVTGENFNAGHVTATLALQRQVDPLTYAYPSGFTAAN